MAANFSEINSVEVTKVRTLVISKNSAEQQIIIGQRMKTLDENEREINFFLKGAIKIPVSSLVLFRDALTKSIDILVEKGDIKL